MKTCARCKETLASSEFRTNAKLKDGLHSYCRRCCRIYGQEWSRANPEKRREQRQRHRGKVPKLTLRTCLECEAEFEAAGGAAICSTTCRRERTLRQARESARVSRYRTKYGLSRTDLDALVSRQGGICAICGAKDSDERLVVDHDHATGTIRGMLCRDCNTGLGFMRDSPTTMQSAIGYLQAAA